MLLIETNPGASLFFADQIAKVYGEPVPEELEIRDNRCSGIARQYLISLTFGVIFVAGTVCGR